MHDSSAASGAVSGGASDPLTIHLSSYDPTAGSGGTLRLVLPFHLDSNVTPTRQDYVDHLDAGDTITIKIFNPQDELVSTIGLLTKEDDPDIVTHMQAANAPFFPNGMEMHLEFVEGVDGKVPKPDYFKSWVHSYADYDEVQTQIAAFDANTARVEIDIS